MIFSELRSSITDVFGWQFSKSGGVPYEFYMIDTIKQGEVGNQEGGMRKRERPLAPDNGVSGYVCYIMVESIDEALEKIAQHGGKVTTPKAHVPAGYFAYGVDTEGNAFGVWEVAK